MSKADYFTQVGALFVPIGVSLIVLLLSYNFGVLCSLLLVSFPFWVDGRWYKEKKQKERRMR